MFDMHVIDTVYIFSLFMSARLQSSKKSMCSRGHVTIDME